MVIFVLNLNKINVCLYNLPSVNIKNKNHYKEYLISRQKFYELKSYSRFFKTKFDKNLIFPFRVKKRIRITGTKPIITQRQVATAIEI